MKHRVASFSSTCICTGTTSTTQSTWRRRSVSVSDPNPTCARPATKSSTPTPERFCMRRRLLHRVRNGDSIKTTGNGMESHSRFTTLSRNQYHPPAGVSPPHSDSDPPLQLLHARGRWLHRYPVVAYAALLIWKSRPPPVTRGIDAAARLSTS